MKKNRIATRIKDKTGLVKSKNRSEDLLVLREQYALFAKNLKFLISTLQNNQAAQMNHSKARLEVAKAINSLTVDTPLFKCAGDIPANAVGTTDGGAEDPMTSEAVPHQNNPQSFAAIHLQLHKKQKMYSDKYAEHIITYAKEWESILSTRIKKHLAQAEKLRVDLDHYGKKVEDLNKSMNKTMSKGKSLGDASVDKVKRNEQKLVQARQEYDRFVNDLCGFIEEIIDRGWKDLHPLLVKMAQFDSTLANEEALLLKGSMAAVTEHLKGMGAKYPGLKPSGRLDELKSWSLESLNKINPGSMRGESPLMIEQGGGASARYLTSANSEASLGIHSGLGGGADYQPDEPGGGGGGGGGMYDRQMSRDNSFASGTGSESGGYGGMQQRSRNNTGDSYDWASGGGNALVPAPAGGGGAAPGYDVTTSPVRTDSFRSPSSGGLPPLGPAGRAASFGVGQQASTRDMSASSIATSGMISTMQAAAPPPTMSTLNDVFSDAPARGGGGGGVPPPPPNMPPPPPPQSASPALSMYGNGAGGAERRMSSPVVPQLSQMSLYDSAPNDQHRAGSLMASPSGRSVNTNPFDDTFGAQAPAGPPTPTHGNPYGDPFGGGNTNPFG
eukprot:CAMPEP_0172534060 /NCGR_PEP_ID=MMETSP1067-20121228/6561_1 /TAXON_ID=265564 ORGANISM="Thalassiosira punctigera, Strain Tpunct2005C2" /NCGR_SAMPLE_ID=MMETSP1067 /ASSEMBLY_ACC=CAM_ASM_000444 /LENGTH=612 /DNA_ID=CAMNT_0013318799 /DNA_START=141 /DNA_END=1979 /DNA_ORIENTATION=+